MTRRCLYSGTLTLPSSATSDLLSAGIELVINPRGRALTEDDLVSILPDFDAALAGPEPYTSRVISAASPRLRIIARTGVGYDRVDLAAATRNDVMVTWTPVPELSASVAEHAFGLMLAVIRRIPQMNADIRAGGWERPRWSMEVGELRGRTLGLLGLGRIGAEVATRASAFGMKVVYYDVIRRAELEETLRIEFVSLDRLLSESDILSIHVPLTSETRAMLGRDALSKMKPTAFLINTSRGEIVDEGALADALSKGRLGGAALDVLSQEPPGPQHVFYKLGDRLPNLVLTGHVSIGRDTFEIMVKAACDDIKRALRGETPRYLLNPKGGQRNEELGGGR